MFNSTAASLRVDGTLSLQLQSLATPNPTVFCVVHVSTNNTSLKLEYQWRTGTKGFSSRPRPFSLNYIVPADNSKPISRQA